ncbi:peptidase [Elizabethkingia anophelis]|uniref:PepSY-associated TM helix domain-containing protein n=1 Tax=Elizabethkingia anophelis TaxID=1117645 RepID=UPI00038A550A|nr:PepSY-associated TM helix domain-containing protein [Elizabethkingia anophelis]EQB92772.1 peptidase [Elizabethkingia anophelis 502]KFC37421.1 peptidase [Elizabethkingia anophelis]MCT4137713.1 PepSY domain-containing protein [Elizabethkingia anophelis]MDV3498854.1 peptidase [Elizabethkingia anophelis]MDV3568957.1 peptidase [Elizabethkingia anophelis]
MQQTDKKKSKGTFKKYVLKVHLWLGLITGIIVLIVSLSGAFFVFNEDITAVMRKEHIFHGEKDIQHKKPIPIHELKDIVNSQLKNEIVKAEEVTIPIDPARSYEFGLIKGNPDGWNYFNNILIYKNVYVNQYTGKVLAVYDIKKNPFYFCMELHRSLLLSNKIGGTIVGTSTIIFVIMLVTGIILWWPKNKKMRKQRLWFRWEKVKGWRRKNYDVHNILGFYASFLAIIVATTGIMYSFRITQMWLYVLLNGFSSTTPDYSQYKTTAPESVEIITTIDHIIEQVKTHYPTAHSFGLDLEDHAEADHKHDNLSVRIKEKEFTYGESSLMIFDEHSGKLLFNRPHKDKLMAQRATDATYDLHVGAFFGFPGKILAFIMSLFCASLPITGFIIWWGRRNKKKPTT